MEIIGNLTHDPDLRYTQNGHAVVSFTVAQSERIFDKTTGEYKDGESLFLRCTAWRDLAENIAGSLTKGQRVVVIGKLRQRDYETKEGEKRTTFVVEVDDVGPSLRFGTAVFQRKSSSASSGSTAASGWDQATAGAGWSEAKYPDETPF